MNDPTPGPAQSAASGESAVGGVEGAIEALESTLDLQATPREQPWRFGLPQLFLLVLAAAVTFGSSRAFGWEHMLCNGPLFLVVAVLARGRRVEALCLQLMIFAGILWLLSLWGVI